MFVYIFNEICEKDLTDLQIYLSNLPIEPSNFDGTINLKNIEITQSDITFLSLFSKNTKDKIYVIEGCTSPYDIVDACQHKIIYICKKYCYSKKYEFKKTQKKKIYI